MMKTRERAIVYTLLALVAAVIPALLLAGPHGTAGPHGPGFGDGTFLDRVADQLELSEGQREEIRGVFEAYRPQTEGLLGELRNAHQALRDRVHAETFDEAAIRDAAAEVGVVSADLAVLRARMHNDVRQHLTPEQVEKARELRELLDGFVGPHQGRHLRLGRGPAFGPSEAD